MPSANYYLRQADTLLSLSVATTDPDRAAELLAWAEDYRVKAIEHKIAERKASEPTAAEPEAAGRKAAEQAK